MDQSNEKSIERVGSVALDAATVSDRYRSRAGLTLVELMIAISVVLLITATLATLGVGVQEAFTYNTEHGRVTQEARVILDRISRLVVSATASNDFPGAIVVPEEVNGYSFPDTLVIWRPAGSAVDPDGLPRLNELVFFRPSPSSPNQLEEIQLTDASGEAPEADDLNAWRTLLDKIDGLRHTQTVLTRRLPTASVFESNEAQSSQARGVVRFQQRLLPSAGNVALFEEGSVAWDELPWVQGVYGPNTGLRQVWIRTELQLLPSSDASDDAIEVFFGSAALYYELRQ